MRYNRYSKNNRKKYNLGGAIGAAAGGALAFIPGVGPKLSKVATPLLSAAGAALQNKLQNTPEQEEDLVGMPADPNAYAAVRTFKYGGIARYQDGGKPPKKQNEPSRNYKMGGKPQLKEIKGPSHEQGGVPLKNKNGKIIGEVEGGETKIVKNGNPEFIFSDSVAAPTGETFADASKKVADSPQDLKKLANLQEVMKGKAPVYKKGGKVKYSNGGKIDKALDAAALLTPIATAAIGQAAYKAPELQTNKGYGRARALMPTRFSMDAARQGVRQSELNTADTLSNMSGSRQGLRSSLVSSRAKSLGAQSDIAMKEQMGQIELDKARAALEVQAGADEQAVANQTAVNRTQSRNARVAVAAQGLKGVGEAAVGIRKDRLAEQADKDRLNIIMATSRVDLDPEMVGEETYNNIRGEGAFNRDMQKRVGQRAKTASSVKSNLRETERTVEPAVPVPSSSRMNANLPQFDRAESGISEEDMTPQMMENMTPAQIKEYLDSLINRPGMKYGGKVKYKKGGRVKYC